MVNIMYVRTFVEECMTGCFCATINQIIFQLGISCVVAA
jgi:hypothetical protein